ncbi:MAG TPA: hypothetical protein VIL07_11015 [Symbiobacteriaceae bacterium]
MGHPKRDELVSRNVGMLISVLVRYPEVGSVKYEPRQQTIRIGLLVQGELEAEEFRRIRSDLAEMLQVYHLLENRTGSVLELEQESYGGLTSLTVTRDVGSLTPDEIYLLIEFFRERFAGRLVTEAVDFSAEEDMMAQDEMIEEILFDLQHSPADRNLIAIRENGRVMVFQK